MKNRSLFVRGSAPQPPTSPAFYGRAIYALLLAFAVLGISSCHSAAYYYYKFPADNFAGRPIPPSKLAQRVMIGLTSNGSSGLLQIVDASRDIRSNVQDTIPFFSIAGYSSGYPGTILNFPSELRGYVYSNSDGSLTSINYSTEATSGPVGTFQSGSSSVALPGTFDHYYGAEEAAGVLEVIDNLTGRSYGLDLPNVYKVFVNTGDTVALATVRNSSQVYRVFKLNQGQFPTQQAAIAATGSVDCQPSLLPVYCAVQVPGTYDHPAGVYFSLDGTTAYVLNCGPECGGATASLTLLQQGPLNENVIPSSPTQPNPMIANVPIPGGVTAAISDGSILYLAGQQLQPDGLFEGFLTTVNQSTNAIIGTYPISDGNHSKLLFADNNTLWIGSQFCATGERASKGVNYNCLTRVVTSTLASCPGVYPLGAPPAACPSIVPNVTPGSATAVLPHPNQNNDQYYYGGLTGICWVQNFGKVYTAYGGQVHVFNTADGSERDNQFVTVQGTALDVAYMDALSDGAN